MRSIPSGSGPVRLPLLLAPDAESATARVAQEVADVIRATAAAGRRCVLILPTGGTPRAVYARWIAEHKAGRLSFKHVVTFNLDEYHGLAGDHPESYRFFLPKQFPGTPLRTKRRLRPWAERISVCWGSAVTAISPSTNQARARIHARDSSRWIAPPDSTRLNLLAV